MMLMPPYANPSETTPSHIPVHVIGAGLAGSEAALQLANHGITVHLYDLKPIKRSPAHHNNDFAEIVCSNSMGAQGLAQASGLLKHEMAVLGCELLKIAQEVSVPAGKALAVDRDRFSRQVTETIAQHPNIVVHPEEVTDIAHLAEQGYVILATGPLTSPALAASLAQYLGRDQLFFFDAASPIIVKESIDFNVAFLQDRYQLDPLKPKRKKSKKQTEVPVEEPPPPPPVMTHEEAAQTASYINCPLEKDHYEALMAHILAAETTPLKDFETASKTQYFESCLPVEVIASRGHHTLRYGPMKPVGLFNPHLGNRPYAVVQLRQDNEEGTLYNMVGFQTNLKWGPQKEMIQMIPGLENAEVIRYGVMHRNTYLHSPEVLRPTLQLKQSDRVLVAGQLTGTEGYTESIATGMMAALNVVRLLQGKPPAVLPPETMLGSLLRYITRAEAIGKAFQPINSNWGILPPLPQRERDKVLRNSQLADRAQTSLKQFLYETHLVKETHTATPALAGSP